MPALHFGVSNTRRDPYKNFIFRIKWDGKYVAGFGEVSGLKRNIEIVTCREGGNLSSTKHTSGQTEYEAITLKRGVTHDLEFDVWAGKIWTRGNASGEQQTSIKDLRKDIIIELYNEAGQKAITYNVYRCWVSEYEYTVIPALDASTYAVAIEKIKLDNEGWELDTSVTEPTAPTF